MIETEDLVEQLEERTHDRIEIADDGDRLIGPGGTELVSARRHQQEITHWIDRRSRYGNPYKTQDDGGDYTREESVENYQIWFEGALRSDRGPFDADDIETLRSETLGCWCLPRLCHGITIMNYLAETYEPQQTLADGGVVDPTVEQLGDVPVCTGCGLMSHVEMHNGICAECWMRANRRAGGGTLKIQAGSVYHDSVGCKGVQEADQWRYVTDEDVVYATTGDSDMRSCEDCLIGAAP